MTLRSINETPDPTSTRKSQLANLTNLLRDIKATKTFLAIPVAFIIDLVVLTILFLVLNEGSGEWSKINKGFSRTFYDRFK